MVVIGDGAAGMAPVVAIGRGSVDVEGNISFFAQGSGNCFP